MMSLQTAIRGVGLALLDVDSETSMFREGGLGDLITRGLENAPAMLEHVADAARLFGQALTVVIESVSGLVAGFQMLPNWLQGLVGVLAGGAAALGMFRQSLVALRGAMNLVGLGAFTRMLSPLGLAITGITLGVGFLVNRFMENQQAAAEAAAELEAYRAAVEGVDNAIRQTQLGGNMDLARNMQRVTDETRRAVDAWTEAYESSRNSLEDILDNSDNLGADLVKFMDTAIAQSAADWALSRGVIEQDIYD